MAGLSADDLGGRPPRSQMTMRAILADGLRLAGRDNVA